MNTPDRRLKRPLLGVILAGALVFSGCTAANTSRVNPVSGGSPPVAVSEERVAAAEKPASATAAGFPMSIRSIDVVGDGDRVFIGTDGPLKYTVFRLSEPSRLIVDMPGVDLEDVAGSIEVNNDYISEIKAVSYGGADNIGRITIGLKNGIDHEVKSGDDSILVSLKKNVFISGFTSENPVVKASAGTVIGPSGGVNTGDPFPAVEKIEKEVAKSLIPATMLVSVATESLGSNTVVTITANGALGNYNAFELDDPSRIVLDVWGVDNSIGKKTVSVGNDKLKSVRIGKHPDKTRIVFDSNLPDPPTHYIEKAGDKLVVTIGEKARLADRVNVASVDFESVDEQAASEEPVPAPAPMEPVPFLESVAKVEVTNVSFRKLPEKATLTIATTGETDFNIEETNDGRTIVVDIADASIPEALSRTLDASRLETPVKTVSSYQESVLPKKTVRVLIKLDKPAKYEVSEQAGVFKIDFPLVAEKAGAVKDGEVITEETMASLMAAAGEQKEFTGKRIDLDMTDANISDILRLMAEVSDLNIIASDDVTGTISLRLKNVPWDQAFEIILKAKGLDKMVEGNVVRVAPEAKIRQEREAAIAAVKADEKLESLKLEFIPINYAKADELIEHVQNVLTERGSVTSESRTNTLIVRDIRKGIDSAKDLVTKLDTVIPQVLIEARIVEATTSFARDLGIQWGVNYGTGGNVSTETFGATTTAGQVETLAQTPNSAFTMSGGDKFAVNLPASGSAGTLGALGFLFGKLGQNPLLLDLRLTAGEQEGMLKTISRPKITTLDNKEAKIEQGESIPFETTSAAGTATTFIDANLSLTVTPHITPDGSVLMKIKASRNSIGSFRTSSGEPSINKKEASTEVLVKDGETTVIGGIVVSDNSDTDRGIPVLKKIPILGWFFKSRSVSDSQTELLIFLTPTIIKDQIIG